MYLSAVLCCAVRQVHHVLMTPKAYTTRLYRLATPAWNEKGQISTRLVWHWMAWEPRHARPKRGACRLRASERGLLDAQVLKQDWPHKWPSFIGDICAASQTSEPLCENSMVILKLLSEEVFDFSRGELTQVKALLLIRHPGFRHPV